MASSVMSSSEGPHVVWNLAGEVPQWYLPIITLCEEELEWYLFIIFLCVV